MMHGSDVPVAKRRKQLAQTSSPWQQSASPELRLELSLGHIGVVLVQPVKYLVRSSRSQHAALALFWDAT